MSAALNQPNPFQVLWGMGYRRLVPIVPPGAQPSPNSSLAKRPASLGKAVGILGRDGWRGFNWVPYESTEDDCQRWFAMGAGVGIKTGDQGDGTWLIGVDADTLNEQWAAVISGAIRERFGLVPARIGRAPKVLYVVRLDGPLKYSRVEFGSLNERGSLEDRVELLSDGRQFVAHGVHPVTRQPYRWAERLLPYHELPVWPAGALA